MSHPPTRHGAAPNVDAWWSVPTPTLFERLNSSSAGLTSVEAAARRERFGPNVLTQHRDASRRRVLWNQLKSPLLLLLIFAAGASLLAGEWVDALIVLSIVAVSVAVGYVRDYRAQAAMNALRARIATRTTVRRDHQDVQVPVEEVVPGDVVLLAAGSLVPADGVVLEATHCHLSESVLTGESFPVEKTPGPAKATAALAQRSGAVFMGTHVRSGTARCLVVATGAHTEFGSIAQRLTLRAPNTEFERGLLRFGYLLSSIMLLMVLLVFTAHVIGGRAPVETLLFAIALAVGLSPELLPAILSINLSRSAQAMAEHGVLVRRLAAIEDLGSIDVLCTDKTGTLTEGVIRVDGAHDPTGNASDTVLELAAVNAALQTGLPSALDSAILAAKQPDLTLHQKLGEIPYDFVRKRISVVVATAGGHQLLTKGAFTQVLESCSQLPGGQPLNAEARSDLERRFTQWSSAGVRVLAVASRALPLAGPYQRADERDLVFRGFITFLDRPKDGVAAALAALAKLGVAVKMISGDNRFVAQHVADLVGLPPGGLLTGDALDRLSDEALWREAEKTRVFAEVDPNQKERIILALKKTGHVIGFMGDGLNDAPAMHAADTSISVDQAADVAREAADFVLLERDLDVLRRGIEKGRQTFTNTLKYLTTTMSANLGNMVSMATVSLFLPFLPLTAGQILLNNFLSDVPAAGIATDRVDPELIARPRRWNLRFLARFMIEFGLLSTAFDFLTFTVLLVGFQSPPDLFRTGWFVESLLTELAVALVLRSRRPFFKSRPGGLLLVSTVVLIPLSVAVPYLPYASLMGFVPMPPALAVSLVAIVALYVVSAELFKKKFYRRALTGGGNGRGAASST